MLRCPRLDINNIQVLNSMIAQKSKRTTGVVIRKAKTNALVLRYNVCPEALFKMHVTLCIKRKRFSNIDSLPVQKTYPQTLSQMAKVRQSRQFCRVLRKVVALRTIRLLFKAPQTHPSFTALDPNKRTKQIMTTTRTSVRGQPSLLPGTTES